MQAQMLLTTSIALITVVLLGTICILPFIAKVIFRYYFAEKLGFMKQLAELTMPGEILSTKHQVH